MNPTIVIGLGNKLLADEGIGLVLLEALARQAAQYPSVVIAVDNIKEAMKKVADAGGKVLGEPMEIPGIGQYVSFTDTEGNRVSMLQPRMPMR